MLLGQVAMTPQELQEQRNIRDDQRAGIAAMRHQLSWLKPLADRNIESSRSIIAESRFIIEELNRLRSR